MSVAEALQGVRTRIGRAAEQAGRHHDEIVLVGVGKRQPQERISAAWQAGLRDFGENTAQGLKQTARFLQAHNMPVRWHFVGRLQRNKVKDVLPYLTMLHSLDRDGLAQELSKRATSAVEVLVQVNIGRESQKGGVSPETAVEFARWAASLPHLSVRGLMAIPPADTEPGPYFRAVNQLLQALRQTPEGSQATELSMGMSGDLDAAVMHGATMVRVGTAIFGQRQR